MREKSETLVIVELTGNEASCLHGELGKCDDEICIKFMKAIQDELSGEQ